MVYNEGLSTINPTMSVGTVGINVTCTERRGRLLDNQWPIGLVPMPAKVHALGHFLPRGSSPTQTQMQVTTAATAPLTYKAQGYPHMTGSPLPR